MPRRGPCWLPDRPPRACSLPWSFGACVGLICLCLQARLEVHRFGITGYGKGKERVLERERAIMLGAQVGAAAAHGR